MEKYYNKKYFEWQKRIGEDSVLGDSWMFKDYINEQDEVLDFGCGGGYILGSIKCKHKYGIEINNVAAEEAIKNGLRIYASINEIPSEIKFDRIISHHALEHIKDPYNILVDLKNRLKENGKFICVTPIDDWRKQKKYIAEDINKHLYTWTPLNLGNLFWAAGFKIEDIRVVSHSLISLARILNKLLPSRLFWFLCKIKGCLLKSRHIIIVATR